VTGVEVFVKSKSGMSLCGAEMFEKTVSTRVKEDAAVSLESEDAVISGAFESMMLQNVQFVRETACMRKNAKGERGCGRAVKVEVEVKTQESIEQRPERTERSERLNSASAAAKEQWERASGLTED
jgi:hypothetical protein